MKSKPLFISITALLSLNYLGNFSHTNCAFAEFELDKQKLETINLKKNLVEIEEPFLEDLSRTTTKLGAFKVETKKIKQKNMSKKFGPLLIGFQLRSLRRQAIGFNLDLMQTLDILAQKDPMLFFKSDDEHYIISPETQDEIKKTLNIFKSNFGLNKIISQKKENAQLI